MDLMAPNANASHSFQTSKHPAGFMQGLPLPEPYARGHCQVQVKRSAI